MTVLHKCPFCGSDETYQFEAIQAYDKAPNKACICNKCGEPLIMRSSGFSKPTHEEYEALLAGGLKTARTGWLMLEEHRKNGTYPPTLTGYRKYYEACLSRLPPKGQQVAEDSFYSGAAWMFTQVKKALLSDDDDEEGFAAIMSILEAEVIAYMAGFPARRKQEEQEKLDNAEREHGQRPN